MMEKVEESLATGTIVAIRGGVVDVDFTGKVPRINALVHAGGIAMEVASLVGDGVVRCIALGPVRGLGLGVRVSASGAGIEVPVGEAAR